MSRSFKLSPQSSVLITTFWPYAVIILLTLLFFYKLAFSGMILARGDMYTYFYPYWHVRNTMLMAGQVPLWSPDIFMGVPLLANSQMGLFYPLNWPLIPFDAPTAITISLLFHVAWALTGAYQLARGAVGLQQLPALLAAVVFALGGYMGAKVENINQFQALAWMPWLFLILNRALLAGTRRATLRYGLLLGIGLALQLLAGHPQTVFITGLGLGIYAITISFSGSREEMTGTRSIASLRRGLRALSRAFILLLCAGIIALLLASPQLIPTLELSRASNRSGGLNPQQAMAFSLNPWIIGRGLLPSYDGLLFGEYMAYLGVIGLGLAVVGIFNGSRKSLPSRLPWIVLVIVGFGLALGLYNPLYWTLASLPGFSFFRVPARWLALFALGAAMLAGVGLQSLLVKRPPWWVFALIVVLVGTLWRASFLADVMAMDVIGPAEPTTRTLVGWALAGGVLLAGLWLIPSPPSPLPTSGGLRQQGEGKNRSLLSRYVVSLLGLFAVLELFAASRVLAYNEVAPPDTFNTQRFTISQLRAYAAEQTPPGRFLSISQALFDPGDIDALTARYREYGMSDLAIRLALVDTKLRELLAANLPLVWGVPSVDGFDGGLLPSGDFSAFTSLLLPPGEERSVDGRLREMLALSECLGACIPEQRWLNLTNTRYLIVDKVYDMWHQDVAYDTTFEVALQPGEQTVIQVEPLFEADHIYLLCQDAGECAPQITFTYEAGSSEVLEKLPEASLTGFALAGWRTETPNSPVSIQIEAVNQAVRFRAITLVDSRTGDFQQLTPPPWKRVLSSDIKLYENGDVLPRAFVVEHDGIEIGNDAESVLAIMRDAKFNPSTMVGLQSEPDKNIFLGQTGLLPQYLTHYDSAITTYSPERIEIQLDLPDYADGSFLILTDAYYPGWVATMNGKPMTIHKADVMFRAVPVPAGKSTVVFEYKPGWWPGILIWGAAAWLMALVAMVFLRRREQPALARAD